MKNLLLAVLAIVASVLGVTNPAYSQQTDRSIVMDNTEIYTFTSSAGITTTINPRAMRAFKKTFNMVEGEKWSKIEDGYIAEFRSDGVRFRVDYDNKGNWNSTTKSYAESKLPLDIRSMVKSVYFDYNIFWVEEITMPYYITGPVYFIHIEDEKGFKNIGVYDGEMRVQSEYQKLR